MRRFLSLAHLLVCAALPGCLGGEYLSLKSDPPLSTDDDSNVRRIHEGDVIVVVATLRKPENNSETVVAVGTFSPDDPAIVAVRRGDGEGQYVIEGVAVGETVLRAKIQGTERASVPIKVLPRPTDAVSAMTPSTLR